MRHPYSYVFAGANRKNSSNPDVIENLCATLLSISDICPKESFNDFEQILRQIHDCSESQSFSRLLYSLIEKDTMNLGFLGDWVGEMGQALGTGKADQYHFQTLSLIARRDKKTWLKTACDKLKGNILGKILYEISNSLNN